MIDRIQINRDGSHFHIQKGSGKTGQIRTTASAFGKKITVEIPHTAKEAHATSQKISEFTPLDLNKNSLIDFINARSGAGAQKLSKGFMGKGAASDKDVQEAFKKIIENSQSKLNDFQDQQEKAMKLLKQKVEENGIHYADEMPPLTLIKHSGGNNDFGQLKVKKNTGRNENIYLHHSCLGSLKVRKRQRF